MSSGPHHAFVYKIITAVAVVGVLVALDMRPQSGPAPTLSVAKTPFVPSIQLKPSDLAAIKQASGPVSRLSTPFDENTVVVYFDNTGTYNYLGRLYAQQLATLLTHFNYRTEQRPVESYQLGDLGRVRASFYLGAVYGNNLPSSFKADALTTKKPLCWLGYNLWQISWTSSNAENVAFTNTFGYRFSQIDTIGYPTVTYKGVDLSRELTDPALGKVVVTDPTKAVVVATAKRTDGLNMPYITRGANLWYVADNPLAYVSWKRNDDRLLAFEDVIHDVLGSNAGQDNRAILRIEDVNPNVPPATLMKLADTLSAQNIPYVVCVIPNGVSNNKGIFSYHNMLEDPAFVNALRYMQQRGGQILVHGWTHQYQNTANPYNGNSGADYEFFRVQLANDGSEVPVGFVTEDSAFWAGLRIDCALLVMHLSGFFPNGWVTPHYIASPTDLIEVKKRFDFSCCRSLTFAAADDGKAYYATLLSPWVTTDMFGMKHIPETIGYVNTQVFAGIPPRLPADLVGYSKAVKVVRDGWAGCYFHWFLDPALLAELVSGVKAQGFRFVAPSATIK